MTLTRILTRMQGVAESLHRLALQEVHAQVRRDGVEAAAMHHARAGLSCRRLVALQHATDPLHLAAEVAVVGPGFGAGLDQRLAVERVRTDRRHDDARRRAELAQRGLVGGVGDNERQRRSLGPRANGAAPRVSPSSGRPPPTSARLACRTPPASSGRGSCPRSSWRRRRLGHGTECSWSDPFCAIHPAHGRARLPRAPVWTHLAEPDSHPGGR